VRPGTSTLEVGHDGAEGFKILRRLGGKRRDDVSGRDEGEDRMLLRVRARYSAIQSTSS
jgi:hypothetical protein